MAHHDNDEPVFITSPEEMKEAVKSRHERQRMEQQAWEDELGDFLSSMSNERLVTLRKLLNLSIGATQPYLVGMITGILQFERKVCPECGEDHSSLPVEFGGIQVPADLSELVPPREEPGKVEVHPPPPEEQARSAPPEEVGPQGVQESLFDESAFRSVLAYHTAEMRAAGILPQVATEAPPSREEQLRAALGLADLDIANMKKYWLDDVWTDDDAKPQFLGYACTGTGPTKPPCGLFYTSIADRMMKAPDDCHGCNTAARWG